MDAIRYLRRKREFQAVKSFWARMERNFVKEIVHYQPFYLNFFLKEYYNV